MEGFLPATFRQERVQMLPNWNSISLYILEKIIGRYYEGLIPYTRQYDSVKTTP